MIIHDVEQGSEEWHKLRAGIPTASEFDKIFTPTGKRSTQAEGYANRLIAEMIVGGKVETWGGNMWSERGNELEPEAANYYALTKGVTLRKVGFITDDARTMGASPDRFIEGTRKGLEIKCPAPHTHVEYLLNEQVDPGYYSQLQGQMLVAELEEVDIISYHPAMPPVIMTVKREPIYLSKLRSELAAFNAMLAEKIARMKALGHME